MNEELSVLGIWENLVVIFGNIYFLVAILFGLFAYYAAISDINKWAMVSFFCLFLLWIGFTINSLFAFIAIFIITLIGIEIVRRMGKP